MADPVTSSINFITNGTTFGIPNLAFFFIIGVVLFIVYLIVSRRPKQKEYKAIDLRKQIKKSLKELYAQYGTDVNKPLIRNGIEVGKVLGFMPVVWNKRLPMLDNIKANKYKEVKDAIMQVQGVDPPIDATTSYQKKDKFVTASVNMKLLKVSSKNKILKLLGAGSRYHIIEESQLSIESDNWIINATAEPSQYYDVMFYSLPARHFIEDVGFRINRENELTELANSVPRVVFWDNEFAKRAMSMREAASIEKERFKGQKEAAED